MGPLVTTAWDISKDKRRFSRTVHGDELFQKHSMSQTARYLIRGQVLCHALNSRIRVNITIAQGKSSP
jgi:TolB-like protein